MRKKNQEIRVLALLRKKKRGITFDDFGTGFRLSAVILKLRKSGKEIKTIKEWIPTGTHIARYVLIGG